MIATFDHLKKTSFLRNKDLKFEVLFYWSIASTLHWASWHDGYGHNDFIPAELANQYVTLKITAFTPVAVYYTTTLDRNSGTEITSGTEVTINLTSYRNKILSIYYDPNHSGNGYVYYTLSQ